VEEQDRRVSPLPGQLAFDLGEPFAEDIVWSTRGMAELMSRAPRPDGRGAETLAPEYRTDRRGDER
jgi:hypothetical protein